MAITSFYKIKEGSHRLVYALLGLLLVYWVLCVLVIVQVCYGCASMFLSRSHDFWMPGDVLAGTIFFACLIAAGHYFLATRGIIKRTLQMFGAQEIDSGDPYHTLFRNTVDEIRIATGNKLPITCRVIPCTSLNGLALRDPAGNATVAVTEGLLARAKRNEIQAVVAQLTAQLLTKDALINTVAFSLFGSLEEYLSKVAAQSDNRSRRDNPEDLLAPVIALLRFGNLINVVLSKSRIFRSDAIAVELTRDPMGLAQALRRLQNSWRGAGTFRSMTEAVLFVSPGCGAASSGSGFFQSLFSAHPALRKRLQNALDMAGKSLAYVDEELERKTSQKASGVDTTPSNNLMWKVLNGETWEGPYDFDVMLKLSWLTSRSFVYRMGAGAIIMAQEDDILGPERFDVKAAKDHCPRCPAPLEKTRYEGVPVGSCRSCGGHLIKNRDIQKVLIRDIVPVSDYIREKVKKWKEFRQSTLRPKIDKDIPDRLTCPTCGEKMTRTLYNYEYAIEVDRCYICKQTWFDADELEILQAMVQEQSQSLFEQDHATA